MMRLQQYRPTIPVSKSADKRLGRRQSKFFHFKKVMLICNQNILWFQIERSGIANPEYWYIRIKILVDTSVSTTFGMFLRKQIELYRMINTSFYKLFM